MSLPWIPDYCEIEAVENILDLESRDYRVPRIIIVECLTAAHDARERLEEKRRLEGLAEDWNDRDLIHHDEGECSWCDERRDACKKLAEMGVEV